MARASDEGTSALTRGGGAEPIRVAHVITMMELGGAQDNTLHTVTHLDPARYQTFLLAGPGGLLEAEARTALGERYQTVPDLRRPIHPLRDLRAYRQLRRALAAIRPQVVHTHSSKAGLLGRLAAARERVPVIVHSIHGFGFHPDQPRLLRGALIAAERLAARTATHYVAVSEANRRQGRRLGLFNGATASVIRSGVLLDRFRHPPEGPAARRALGLPAAAPVVGTVACFKPQKAPLDFVATAARVAAAVPGVQFLVAGDGVLRPQVEAAIRRARVPGVRLLGWRRDVPRLLAAMDVFCLTSRWEGLPRAVIEARAAGVPVVATDVDGVREAVREGVDGYLAPPGHVGALAAKVVHLLTTPGLREKMGTDARHGLAGWDIHDMVRQQAALYDRLLDPGAPSRP